MACQLRVANTTGNKFTWPTMADHLVGCLTYQNCSSSSAARRRMTQQQPQQQRLPSQQFGCNCNKGSRKRLIANWQQHENHLRLHHPRRFRIATDVGAICHRFTSARYANSPLGRVVVGCGNKLSATCQLPQTVDCVRLC